MRKKLTVVSFLSAVVFLAAMQPASAQDIKPEEILEKHIAAVGGREKLAQIRNRIAAGSSEFESKLPSKKTSGKVLIASDKDNLMFIASFASKEYPMERIGYFNKEVSLPWVSAGVRSPLGAYLADHGKLLSDGLFTGVITSNSVFIEPGKSDGKLISGGTRTVDGRKAHVLNYLAKGIGSQDFTVKLFFDAETFRHIRTEYRHEISPTQERIGILGVQSGVKISLTETFGDFRAADGYTFPYGYKATYRTESNSGTYEYIWTLKIGAYNLNQNLSADFFKFQ